MEHQDRSGSQGLRNQDQVADHSDNESVTIAKANLTFQSFPRSSGFNSRTGNLFLILT